MLNQVIELGTRNSQTRHVSFKNFKANIYQDFHDETDQTDTVFFKYSNMLPEKFFSYLIRSFLSLSLSLFLSLRVVSRIEKDLRDLLERSINFMLIGRVDPCPQKKSDTMRLGESIGQIER